MDVCEAKSAISSELELDQFFLTLNTAHEPVSFQFFVTSSCSLENACRVLLRKALDRGV
jgi:hypothetical protein